MWPIGQPELAVAVEGPEGGPPRGCACFNSAEDQVLSDGEPAEYYAALEASIGQAARNACDAAVPAGYDHDCYVEAPDGPSLESSHSIGAGACVGDCAYTDECGDPDPYECEEILNGGDETTGAESEDEGILDASAHIHCTDAACEIDEDFARMLWTNPTLLMDERARLVYDSTLARFRLQAVDPNSVAHELGLREGDVIESINGVTIRDLDTALGVYVDNSNASALRVRIARSSQWIDFTYTFTR